jgi:tRNA(Arg) A34 adenosine deaminase TadA
MSTTKTITSVGDAASLAAVQAMTAYCNKTFSVGGLLVDRDGRVIHQMHNQVIVDGALHDPTAHGERQLVDWYHAQLAAGVSLPEPKDISVVTSLDPCCMCTGAILTAGFRAVTVAEDRTSGINFDESDTFNTLPGALRPQALKTFSYPAIVGTTGFVRPARGAKVALPSDHGVDERTAALCEVIFDDTLQRVRDDINSDTTPDKLLNLKNLPAGNYIREAVQSAFPSALSLNFERYAPDGRLAEPLIAAMRQDKANGGPGNAVALIDYFGNLVGIAFGEEHRGAIQTAFMRMTRTYAGLRHSLFDLYRKDHQQFAEDPHAYLAHPKYCTFVAGLSPDRSSRSYMELGAYGSTMEGPLPATNPLQYQYCVARLKPDEVAGLCAAMPPLYSQIIKIAPGAVQDSDLANQVADAWKQF